MFLQVPSDIQTSRAGNCKWEFYLRSTKVERDSFTVELYQEATLTRLLLELFVSIQIQEIESMYSFQVLIELSKRIATSSDLLIAILLIEVSNKAITYDRQPGQSSIYVFYVGLMAVHIQGG